MPLAPPLLCRCRAVPRTTGPTRAWTQALSASTTSVDSGPRFSRSATHLSIEGPPAPRRRLSHKPTSHPEWRQARRHVGNRRPGLLGRDRVAALTIFALGGDNGEM